MIRRTYKTWMKYLSELKEIDLLDFNKFIFRNVILHLFRTQNILPFFFAIGLISFSIAIQESRFLFIPQASATSFASFFLFAILVSIITLVIYPIIIIMVVNFLSSYVKNPRLKRFWVKFTVLVIGCIAGIFIFTGNNVPLLEKMQIVIIWIGLYFVLASLYITHFHHKTLTKLTKTKITFIMIIALTMTRPLIIIFIHTSEVLNITNTNTQLYLSQQNCDLLHNLNGKVLTEPENSIFHNPQYYRDLPNAQGCYIYGNTIRYGFASDFVLLVKKNITPLMNKKGDKYNEYVRLSCYSSNCYSENHIYFRDNGDMNAALISKGAQIDRPL